MACKTKKINKPSKRKMSTGGILTSTVTGAASGAALGPWGIAGGAVLGLGTGVLNHMQEQQQEDMQKKQLDLQKAASQQTYRTSPYAELYAYGGMPVANAELEQGEPFMTPDGKLSAIPTSAPTHAQGGVQMNLPEGTRILGKKKMDDGKQFKEVGRKLTKIQSKYLKSLENNPTSIESNTAKQMLKNVQKEFNALYEAQGVDVNELDMTSNNEYAKGGWIQKAVNPKHKGYCTPMTKSTCTPRRKALARTFKKHHGFHEEGGMQYPEGGTTPSQNPITTERGVSTPYYRPLTPVEFQQQLARKGVLSGDISTMPVDSINSNIQKAYNIQDGFALPYRASVNKDGKTLYEKDYGRNRGEYYSEIEPGKVTGGYNNPRVKYHGGGTVEGNNSDVLSIQERPYTEQNVYSQYMDPNTNKPFYAVKRTDYNISNPNVYEVSKGLYGTTLNPHGGNTGNLQYEPSVVTKYNDTGEYKVSHPSGYEPYLNKFSGGGMLGKYDEPNATNGYSMAVQSNSMYGIQEPQYQPIQPQQYQINQNTSQSTSNPNQVIARDPFAQPPVPQQGHQGYGNLGNVLSTAASLAPVAYNLIQGAKGSEQLNYKDYLNPYNDYVRSLMADRRYNVEPELEANRLNQSTYNNQLRNAAPSQAQLLGGMQAGSIQKQRADSEAIARKQNIDNQYMGEQAQMDYSLGRDMASTKMGVQDINARSSANARNMTATGLSQLSNFAQNKQIMHNQIIRDAQKMGLLDDLIANYTFKNGDWTFKTTGQKVDPEEVLRYVKGI